MDNDIKEILDRMEEAKDINAEQPFLDYHESRILLDYITNLQKELNYYITHCEEQKQELHRLNEQHKQNKKEKRYLKEENKRLQQRNIELMVERDRARGENKVLQERMDKAIEILKKGVINKVTKGKAYINLTELFNILVGDDK